MRGTPLRFRSMLSPPFTTDSRIDASSQGTMGSGVVVEEGKSTGMWALGIVVLWNVCTVAHIRLAVEVAHWNWFLVAGFALSFLGFWAFW